MQLILFLATLFFASSYSQEYVASVPEMIDAIVSVAGTVCESDSDCETAFVSMNATGLLTCMKDTVTFSDNSTEDVAMCQYFDCESDAECGTNEICWKLNECDPNNEFISEDYMLQSSFCYSATLCSEMRTQSAWTADTMCYLGEDDITYYSDAEVRLCADSEQGTCTAESGTCEDLNGGSGESKDCTDDETCCGTEDWDETLCLELLLGAWLLYTIAAGAFVVLLCCLCCCCIYRSRKNHESEEEMDNQTNNYNVYI